MFWHCLAQNVDRLFFQDGGEMQREYDRLFKSLFASPDAYTAIIKVLAEHKRGLSRDEIALKCKMSSNGYLTRILSNLVNCDFIRSFRVKDKKIKANAQCYQLTDLIIERADQIVNVCEMKYSEFPYVICKAEDMRLRNQMGAFREETLTKGGLHLTFISIFGVKQNLYSDVVRNEVTLDDLFRSLL